MSLRILLDDRYDRLLEEEGFAVVPFLSEAQVKTLSDVFFGALPGSKEGMYATAHSGDYDFKKKMNDAILQEFSAVIDKTFFECTPLGGSFIAKYKGDKGVLFPHQDWNIVDEDFYRSFNIWVPLVDTSHENGAISVLPRSHKLLKSYRGVNIPDPYYKANSHAWQFHQTLDIKAGDALIYDHRLLHASSINQTDVPRVAVVFGIIPSKAEMRLYYFNNNVVEEYENNVDFFFKNDILKGPQGLKKLRDITYEVKVLSEEDFDEMYLGKKKEGTGDKGKGADEDKKRARNESPKSFFKKILEAIGA